MKKNLKPLKNPLLITRPLLVGLNEFNRELEKVWSSGWVTNNGFSHQELEKKLKEDVLRVPSLSLVANATLGLLMIQKLFKLEGEVITTPFTFPATPHSISWAGLKPVFCDIDPVSMNIDSDKIEDKITSKTSAILAVHVFGQPCDVEKIAKIAKKNNLKVIYDAAHAFELEINGKSIASYGDSSVFSLHATKLYHTAEGGAVTFADPKLKDEFDVMKNFGIKGEEVVNCGINIKMNELQAALGLAVLKFKDQERKERLRVSQIYEHELLNMQGLILPKFDKIVTKKSLQYFAIRIVEKEFGKSRDSLWKKLKELNIFARRYFYPLCTEYPHYKDDSYKETLPVAYKAIDEVLCLPFFGGITDAEAKFVCDAIKEIRNN
jgi:dTDP-4-amino-4,6-dideoxygalactose transaminase